MLGRSYEGLVRVHVRGVTSDSAGLLEREEMPSCSRRCCPHGICCYALLQMHDNKYLHLPVVDQEAGTVQGVVSVMEIIQATAGDRGSHK